MSIATMLWQEVLPASWTPMAAGAPLYDRIGSFYDASTSIWEKVWGEHLHSGFYDSGVDTASWNRTRHLEAQDRMMRELIALWPRPAPKTRVRVLDMGCGVGGSARFLYRYMRSLDLDAEVVGITLSTYQRERAAELTAASQEIPAGAVSFQLANALETPFPNASFDLIWSLESGEHMPGKSAWLREVARLLCPGGAFVCATWCHREVSDRPLEASEVRILERICKNYALPAWVPLSAYGAASEENGLLGFERHQQSWTTHVLPFWPAVIWSSLRPYSVFRLLVELPFGGWATIKGAITAILMMQGFQSGTLNFGVFAVRKAD